MTTKRPTSIFSLLFVCLLTMAPLFLTSCGDDDPEETTKTPDTPDTPDKPDTPDTPSNPTGTVEFSLGDTNIATADHPAQVTVDEPLLLTISQQSVYTESNGQKHECQPKAQVKVTVDSKEVRADNLKDLLSVEEKKDNTTEGTSPIVKSCKQRFAIGPQVISFDLSYEVFLQEVSDRHTIYMPYVKLDPAHHGTPTAQESTRSASVVPTAIHLSGIRLTPINAKTRGTYTTEQRYKVVAGFTILAQTAGEGVTAQQQTLYVEACYESTVTTQHEYPDPELTYDYTLQALSGTINTQSPFTLSGQQMELQWKQTADYTWFNLEKLQTEALCYGPEARTTLTLSKDTVWVEDVDELENVVAGNTETSVTEMEDTKLYTGKKSFTIGEEQKVDFNWSYQTYQETEVEGIIVAWPYLTLSEPQLVSVQKTELPFVTIPGKNAKVYEVTMVLKQAVTGVHTPKKVNETVEYIVKYIGAVELKLLEVKYRKAYEWYEPHDNLPIRNQYILYKDSIFSDGTTRTAESHSQTCSVNFMVSPSHVGFQDVLYTDTLYHRYDGNDILFHVSKHEWNEAYRSPMITATKTGVPDLSKLSVGEPEEDNYDGEPCTNLEAYFYGTTNDRFNSENPQNGWYVGKFAFSRALYLEYDGIPIRQYALILIWYDRFAYTDGKMFDFLDYKATLEFNLKQENTTMPDGSPAIVFTHEGIIHWCGKDFYSATVDSVYQRK